MSNVTFATAGKKKNVKLTCKYKDCGVEFEGYPNTKYCPFHQDQRNREIVVKKEVYDVTTRKIEHKHTVPVKAMLECSCPGCENQYEVLLYPEQVEYPKYCEDHRNKWKRDLYLLKNHL